MSPSGGFRQGWVIRWLILLSVGIALGCSPVKRIDSSSGEIQIAYFGPDDPNHPVAGEMWQAACMALDKANQIDGFNGRRLRLIPCWAEDPWSGGVNAVTRAVFNEQVCAVIGGIDGPTTHLAEQVVVKAHLAMINPAATDKTVNLAFVPWMFSCLPDDQSQSRILAEAIDRHLGLSGNFVVLSANDHDSQLFTVELLRALGHLRRNPLRHIQFDSQRPDPASFDQMGTHADVLLLIAEPRISANLLINLREKGFTGPVFGGPWMARNLFRRTAGPAAEGVVFPLLWSPSTIADRFIADFRARTGKNPDYLAAQTYDAVLLLAEAIRKSGPDRLDLIDSIRNRSPWQGIAGMIQWDPLGRNQRPVILGTIRNGQNYLYSE
ncbi:MAG: ABC transporter substrate-binding protein [Phycisphaerae bacterium]|nr:ABC transporter substrate-binding protein [Phycisphaerae bacterium]